MGSAAWNRQQVDMSVTHEILQLFRHAFRDPTAAVRRRGGRAPCMIRDPTAAVRRAAVAHHA